MTNLKVVLIGEFDDSDLIRVRDQFATADHEVTFLPLGLSADDYEVSWEIGNSPVISHADTSIDVEVLNMSHGVLFKLWTMDERPLVASNLKDPSDRPFAEREWNATLLCAIQTLLGSTTSLTYGSPREAAWHDWKPFVLGEAIRAGLHVPATRIATAHADFAESVVKSVNANPSVADSEYFPTTAVTSEVGLALRESTGVPNLVQKRVRRERERRVIVVGDRLLTVEFRVDSDVIDARYLDHFEITDAAITPARASALGRFAQHMGFSYCCFDCIIDSRNYEWLIDVTPRGSWQWLEEEDDPTISRLVAEILRS